MLSQDEKNIDLVRGTILNRKIHKANTEANILKSICKRINMSRSEAKKFLDKYTGTYWRAQKDNNGTTKFFNYFGRKG